MQLLAKTENEKNAKKMQVAISPPQDLFLKEKKNFSGKSWVKKNIWIRTTRGEAAKIFQGWFLILWSKILI